MEEGFTDYLLNELKGQELIPKQPYLCHFKGGDEELDAAVTWACEGVRKSH